MKAKSVLSSAIVISTLFIQVTFAAPPRYEIIDLGTLGGEYSCAHAINDAGQVVGISFTGDSDHAFLWDSSTGMIDLGMLPLPIGGYSVAYGINEVGQVVGYSGSDDGSAFIWDSEKGMRYLDGIGTGSTAFDINNRGHVVGDAGYAFLWDPDNGVVNLGTLGGSTSSAQAINNIGQVVGGSSSGQGFHAFLWDSTNGMRDLGTLGSGASMALGINNHGQVVGRSQYEPLNDNYHAFLWDNNNGMIDLSSSFAFGTEGSIASAINDAGQIVGHLNPWGPSVAFYLDIDNGMIKLEDLIPPGSIWKVLKFAFDINNRGQIVGQGITNSGKTLAFLMTPVPPKTIYVDDDAAGANDGSSWADAFNFLQDALAAAWYGDEIRVAQGIYKPDRGAVVTTGNREATFQLINSVTLKGGYAGFGESDPNARDIELYETILTGDLDGNDIDVNNPAVLLWEPTRAENSYHVVTGSKTDETAILDGFTITGGNANRDPRSPDYLWKRGGGIYSYSGSPTLMNCTISGNSASIGGGIENLGSGMFNHLNCNPTVINCAISRNNGGGIRSSGSPTLINCTISGNNGCGMSNGLGSPTMTNCTISGNNDGAWFSCDSDSVLVNCVFVGNSSDWNGGAWFSVDSDSVLVNCIFVGNSARNEGGGIYSTSDYSMTLTNCILWGNRDSGGMDASAQIDGGGSINYCCIQGGLVGTGNIDSVPLFVDPGYWDANGTPDDANDDVWVDGDYHLLPGSPCIDAGDPNYMAGSNETDLDGRPRIINGRIDMGAYESPIFAEARILPRTINLASKGKSITCYIWLPEGYDVADIDPESVLLEDEIKPDEFSVDEHKQVATATFDREKVQSILNVGDIELTITCQLTDGTYFEATDVIKITDKGGGK